VLIGLGTPTGARIATAVSSRVTPQIVGTPRDRTGRRRCQAQDQGAFAPHIALKSCRPLTPPLRALCPRPRTARVGFLPIQRLDPRVMLHRGAGRSGTRPAAQIGRRELAGKNSGVSIVACNEAPRSPLRRAVVFGIFRPWAGGEQENGVRPSAAMVAVNINRSQCAGAPLP